MTFRKILTVFLFGLSTTMLALAAKKKPTPEPTPTIDPAAMEQAMKRGAPAETHKVFDPLVGTWTAVVRGWMKPGDKPVESTGTSKNTLIYGGRFLKQEFKGSWAGSPFEGMGLTGFDNLRGYYQSTWIDNFSTGIMVAKGDYDTGFSMLKFSGTFSHPMTGERDRWFRSEWQAVDEDNNVYSSYAKGPDGKEFKSMEIAFKRIK